MKPCPHCDQTLGVAAYLSMSAHARPTCPHCGERYGWDVSGRMMLLVPVIAIGSMSALISLLPRDWPAWSMLVIIPALIGVCAAVAIAAMKPVPLNPPSRSAAGST